MKSIMAVFIVLGFFCQWQAAFAQIAVRPETTELKTPAGEQTSSISMTEEEKVGYLINYVRNLVGATFIRNGKDFDPGKAADHLNSKWEKHKKKVKTAHGFVQRLATFSKSKEPYQIRFSDGNTVKCGDLLAAELQRIEQ